MQRSASFPVPPLLPKNKHKHKDSPYRFGATRRMLSYPDTLVPAHQTINTTFVTSVEDVLRYQRKRAPTIPKDEPIVYFVTPTHARDTQMADLTTLGQTLQLDGNVYWIVVEDANACSRRIRVLLERVGLPFAHVTAPTNRPNEKVPPHRGVDQRNKALDIIEFLSSLGVGSNHTSNNNSQNTRLDGIVYFGDDDNTYDVHLFRELRKTKTVGVLPVGFVGGGPYERCIVHPQNGTVRAIATAYAQKHRTFPIDMAGFCFHTRVLSHPIGNKNTRRPPRFQWNAKAGALETFFLEQIATHVSDLEPLANNCTQIYVWHTKSVSLESSKAIKPALDTYFDGIGSQTPPVFPKDMTQIAFRVGGVTVDIPRDHFDEKVGVALQNPTQHS